MNYAREIFKAYDIRGIVETQLTPDVVINIGKVLGNMALAQKVNALVVGYDGRLSSFTLSENLINGILSVGCDVFHIGQVTTPMVYFANFELGTMSGIMITGSHNPPEYNGFKMVLNGNTLYGDTITSIYQQLVAGNFKTLNAKNGVCNYIDISERYMNKITSDIKLFRKMNIAIDCGNGVAGTIAPKLYRRLGAKVLGLFCEVDGNFPNHHPDPSQLDNLIDLQNVLLHHEQVEIGLAFDGDADRLGVITKNGNIIYPDRQMMLFAADVLEKNPGAKIIYDVKSSRLLEQWITQYGGTPIMCRTGHSFIKAKIKETNAKLAGEMSGHIFFNDR
jgi:phosphomannomutase/phosphoglucomutase